MMDQHRRVFGTIAAVIVLLGVGCGRAKVSEPKAEPKAKAKAKPKTADSSSLLARLQSPKKRIPTLKRFLVVNVRDAAIDMAVLGKDRQGQPMIHDLQSVPLKNRLTATTIKTDVEAAITRGLKPSSFKGVKDAFVCLSADCFQSRFRVAKLSSVEDLKTSQNFFPVRADGESRKIAFDGQLMAFDQAGNDTWVFTATAKASCVASVRQACSDVGLKVWVTEAQPSSLYNAARANYAGEQQADILVCANERRTDILVVDRARVVGFNDDTAKTSAVLTKQLQRAIALHRNSGGKRVPKRILVCGHSAPVTFVLAHGLPIKPKLTPQLFNGFQVVAKAGSIDLRKMGQDAHLLFPITGTALRAVYNCPIETDLRK